NFRCQPLEKILEEARLNIKHGNGVLLHAEDVLRYKTQGFTPNEKEVIKLFREIKKLTNRIGISHFAHASVVSKPKLIEKISELTEVGSKENPFISGQVGIETGSVRLIAKHMRGKAKPFKPEEWPEMIIESHKTLADNQWVPCNTLIIGLPGEKPDDIRRTIELVESLHEYKSLIVPLYFVPIGHLSGKGFFRTKHMLSEHWQLFAACMKHDFKWIYTLADQNLPTANISRWKIWTIKKIIRIMERRLTPCIELMEEGIDPTNASKNI
ncbi:MAG: radical SAM protein, partial [Thermoplasmata archaeon]